MKYEVKMSDWILDLDVNIKSDDFDLISEIQMAIEVIVDSFHEAHYEALNESEETEETEEESIDFEEVDDEDVSIEGTQGTVVIINTK